jgi:hypothetical protein
MKVAESQLAEPTRQLFSRSGYVPFDEIRIPVGQKRVDLMMVHRSYPKMVAVELKVSDWKTAVRQALFDTHCSHFSYVALWHEACPNVDKTWLEKTGVGLISVTTEQAEIEVRARRRVGGLTEPMKEVLESLHASDKTFLWL